MLFQTVIPLQFFGLGDASPFQFGPDVTIAPLPAWLKAQSILKDLSSYDRDGLLECSHCFLYEYEAAAMGSPDPAWTGAKPRSIQKTKVQAGFLADLALWLQRPSPAGFTVLFHASEYGDSFLVRGWERHDRFRCHPDDAPNRLTQDDIEQIQRAFHLIYDNIIGNSMPAGHLRATIWQSIFTHDMRRYRRVLYRKMGEFPTLITGPSGTGKELIARAIAGSLYVPFDPERKEFADARTDAFLPINIAAFSPTLIESELFGHRRGSFTGAIGDRKGWLEACPPSGSVFLDELGEMDLAIQVKLLRVINAQLLARWRHRGA